MGDREEWPKEGAVGLIEGLDRPRRLLLGGELCLGLRGACLGL